MVDAMLISVLYLSHRNEPTPQMIAAYIIAAAIAVMALALVFTAMQQATA